MITEIKMPQLGESVTEGTITKWLKKPGDFITKYETICEVATDKVNAEVPSTIEGKLVEIVQAEGNTIQVGHIICLIEGSVQSTEEISDSPKNEEEESPQSEPSVNKSLGGRYSPAVVRLAEEHGIDLKLVTGTGGGGRITRKDVLKFIEKGLPVKSKPSEASPRPPQQALPILNKEDQHLPLSPVRRTIAERMVMSKKEIPHAWLMMEVDVTGLVELRNKLKNDFIKREGVNLTFLPFFIQSVSEALREYPHLNSIWAEDKIVLKKDIHISIAVATEEALFVPVIHHANEKNIVGLAKAVHKLVDKTKKGSLTLDDLQGGTFTVNNTGAFGSIASTPIINYPQAAILSFEAIVKRPVVINNMIAIRDMMNLCLSIDHRVLDGLMAGNFLKRMKESLESVTIDTII